MNKNGVTVLSLFDGISCGLTALKKSGINVNKYYASEIKEDGIKVAMDNHPEIIQIGDVTKVSYKDGILYTENVNFNVGEIDILIGGSPCQDFSQANKVRAGLEGVKSGLFFEWLRLRNEIQPSYYLLENVRMKKEHQLLVNNYVGTTPININSREISAQLRNRYYWTNINSGNIRQPDVYSIKLNDILEYGYSNREKSRCLLEGDSRPIVTPIKMFHRYYSTGFTTIIFKDKKHYDDCKQHYDDNFSGLSAKQIDDKLENNNINIEVYNGVRILNQTELERLQTLPEGYTKTLNRNQAAGVIGDGWTVDVISHIFNHLPNEWKR